MVTKYRKVSWFPLFQTLSLAFVTKAKAKHRESCAIRIRREREREKQWPRWIDVPISFSSHMMYV